MATKKIKGVCMQVLAIEGLFFNEIIELFTIQNVGVVLLIAVGIFVAVRSNIFIKISLNNLTKQLEKVNDELSICRVKERKNELQAKKEQLEQKINAKIEKTYHAIKLKTKRMNRFENYIEKHAKQHPNLLNTLGDKISNFKDILDCLVLENSNESNVVKGESLIQDEEEVLTLQQENELETIEDKTNSEEQIVDESLSSDKVAYRRESNESDKSETHNEENEIEM